MQDLGIHSILLEDRAQNGRLSLHAYMVEQNISKWYGQNYLKTFFYLK